MKKTSYQLIVLSIFLATGALFVTAQEMPTECSLAGITDPARCEQYLLEKLLPIECREAGIVIEQECRVFMEQRGQMTQENLIKEQLPAPCVEGGITEIEKCQAFLLQKYLPQQCKDAGITTQDGCEQYLIRQNLPPECQAAGLTDREACEALIFKKTAPAPCVQQGLTDQSSCEEFITQTIGLPKECFDAGISGNHDACLNFLSDKYGSIEKIPLTSYPPECVKAGSKTPDECEKVITEKFMPQECLNLRIANGNDCQSHLTNKYLPKDCVAAGQTSKEGCDAVMFRKFAPKECVDKGITEENACRRYMTKLLTPKIVCEGLTDEVCLEQIEKNHIGKIVAKRGNFEELKTRAKGPEITVSKLSDGDESLKTIVPLTKEDTRLLILNSNEDILLNADDNIIQTAPIALMFDSDGDGLSNDFEIRLGSDPSKVDTDGNGSGDREEVKEKQNPAGEGELKENLAPIDNAILEGRSIEHPIIDGKTSADLQVEAAGETGEFSGKAEANTVVTLYVYSELPVVVTVRTDKFGNWKYEMAEPLRQGEHEVYVAVNDKTGKIEKKSSPFRFIIPEARAAGIDDVAGAVVGVPTGYILAIGSAIALALVGFAAFLVYRKSGDSTS